MEYVGVAELWYWKNLLESSKECPISPEKEKEYEEWLRSSKEHRERAIEEWCELLADLTDRFMQEMRMGLNNIVEIKNMDKTESDNGTDK